MDRRSFLKATGIVSLLGFSNISNAKQEIGQIQKINDLKKIGFCELKVVNPYGWLNEEFPSTIYIPTRKIREVKNFAGGPIIYYGKKKATIDSPTIVRFDFNELGHSDDAFPFSPHTEATSFWNVGWSDLSVYDFNSTYRVGDVFIGDKEIELIKYDNPINVMRNKQKVKVKINNILYIEKVQEGITMIKDGIGEPFNYSSLIWTHKYDEFLYSELTPEELINSLT